MLPFFARPITLRPCVDCPAHARMDFSIHQLVSIVALAGGGLMIEPKPPLYWVTRAVQFLVCGVALYFLLRPGPRDAGAAGTTAPLPEKVTALDVLNLLRRIEQGGRLSWSPQERLELAQTICELEQRLFGPDAEPDGQAEADLELLARKWLARIP